MRKQGGKIGDSINEKPPKLDEENQSIGLKSSAGGEKSTKPWLRKRWKKTGYSFD